MTLREHLEAAEKALILKTLNATEWYRKIVAAKLDISRKSLWEKINKYGLQEFEPVVQTVVRKR